MANLRELRNRIGSVKNTRKITAAMSQIAAARLKKAQDAVTAAKPYGDRMRDVIESLVAGIEESERAAAHPLLAVRPVKRELVIVMTADRGLCGGFNSNIVRAAAAWIHQQLPAMSKHENVVELFQLNLTKKKMQHLMLKLLSRKIMPPCKH